MKTRNKKKMHVREANKCKHVRPEQHSNCICESSPNFCRAVQYLCLAEMFGASAPECDLEVSNHVQCYVVFRMTTIAVCIILEVALLQHIYYSNTNASILPSRDDI